MKKKNRNTTTRINFKFLLPVIVCVLIIAVLITASTALKKIFSIKHIECQIINQESCNTQLIESLKPLTNQPLFFKDYVHVLQMSQTINQPVTIVSIKKKLPDTLYITFQLEPAVYSITKSDTKNIVSESGKIFQGVADASNIFSVETEQELSTEQGFVFPDVHHTVLTIITTAKELKLPLTKLSWVDKSTIKLSMENREELYIVDSDSPRLQLHKLSMVLKSSEYREIAEPKLELDLRFNMPVLRTQP